jgi:uncharacterized protein (UPF0371 family)
MPELFETATRNKVRFQTVQGPLTIEDLWSLPLKTTRSDKASLDALAVGLNRQVQETGTVSFVDEATTPNAEAKLKFDIVLHIIGVKKAEAQAAVDARVKAELKEKIAEAIANKRGEAISAKTLEELEAEYARL